MQAMKERDDTRPLGGWVQLDYACGFQGKVITDSIGK